jgi:putative peptidoglycan lipid II flippase
MGGRIDDGGLRRTYVKLLCAACPAAGLGWAAARACAGLGDETWPTAVALAAGALATALAYLLLARLLKVNELRRLPGMR